MKRSIRLVIGAVCAVLLLISWFVTVSAESTTEKQIALMRQAAELINDGIYIRAVPLLEEAAGYNAAHTFAAEEMLKRTYLALLDNRGFSRRYLSLLERQMSRRDASSCIFAEAANFYLSVSRTTEALRILRAGIERTRCDILTDMYERNRYAIEMSRTSFDYIAPIHNSTVQVKKDGFWGIARANGTILIPTMYDKISTFCGDRVIVMKDGEVFAVDRDNNRIAFMRGNVTDIGNLAENRIPVKINENWQRATGELVIGNAVFEALGTYSGGFAAAKLDGKWGVIDFGTRWLVYPEYDRIIMDELARCYGQGAVFAQRGDVVYLYINGQKQSETFEDARPFTTENYAAVKRHWKWGFVDTTGMLVIEPIFDDAMSFSQHLAAVKINDFWGYISIYGQVVIDPAFLEAKSFSNGSAPVLTERGWQFITLLEYK